MADIDLGKAFARLEAATPRRESGRVTEVTGLVIRASVPGVRVGEVVNIASPDRAAPDPMSRPRVSQPLPLGVRVLDGLLTVGQGQRVGIFAGSGVGKSTLMGQIARQTEADVNVIALVGERGREVVDFLEESLGAAGRARSVVVCATSDAPSLVRLKAAFVATAVAEYFREQGRR